MKRLAIGTARTALNLVYRARARSMRLDEAVFLSRQTNTPSYDFAELDRALQARGWKTTMHLKKVRARNLPAYVLHVWKEIGLLGRSKAVILDRYDPVVSLIDFECEPYELQAEREDEAVPPANTTFPAKPLVLQLWHAFGSYKKFGFQSNDTPEGHTSQFMKLWRIHHNYSWVACSGEGSRKAYAEAFSCPVERVVVLDRPERDELAALKAHTAHAKTLSALAEGSPYRPQVLMAPTLRIATESAHPFKDLYASRASFESKVDADFTWAFHPLDSGLPAPGNVSKALLDADVVVTDYSSIVYEAWLLGIPAVFYVPDLDEYRASPGLNSDPGRICPSLCLASEQELAAFLSRIARDPSAYPQQAFDAFALQAFDEMDDTTTAAERLADFIVEHAR